MLSATGNLFQVTKGLKYPVAENGRCTRGWVVNRIRPPRDSDQWAAVGLPCHIVLFQADGPDRPPGLER